MNSTDHITVTEWLYRCLDIRKQSLESSTLLKYHQLTDCYIAGFFSEVELADADENDIQRFYNALIYRNPPLSSQTIHLIANVLHQGFAFAYKLQLIKYDPTELAYIPLRSYDHNVMLKPEIICCLMQKRVPNLYENFYPLLLITCMRFSELAALSWDDIDFQTRRVHIHRSLTIASINGKPKTVISNHTKNHQDRTIILPKCADAYLDDERNKQRRDEALNPGSYSLVFRSETGSPVPHYKVTRRFKKIANRYGQPEATLHSLRHTGATLCYNATGRITSVMALTGHSSYGAASYYLHSFSKPKG